MFNGKFNDLCKGFRQEKILNASRIGVLSHYCCYRILKVALANIILIENWEPGHSNQNLFKRF